MKNCWDILGIGPTTDKKTIKRAYAAKTREIHPEEKPEEFKQLYEAYQAALKYADYSLKIERIETETAQTVETAGEPEAENEELLSFFEKNRDRQERRIDAFLQYWDEMQSPFRDPKALNRWKTYFSSEEFQEIRFHGKVLSLLADGTGDKRFNGIIEVKALLWDAYGFQEGEGRGYQGDIQRLYRNLYPAFLYQQHEIAKKENQKKIHKRILLCLGIAAAAVLVCCALISVRDARQRENERLFVADYMAKQYPMAEFSDPERLGEEENGDIVYTLNPSAHPELSVTVVVKDWDEEENRRVTEDYSQALFGFYAAQYGLEAGLAPYTADTNALFYPDIEEVDAFCEQAEKMFREQEELQMIPEVAFLPQNVLFSLVMFDGGSLEHPFADKQVYDPKTVKAQELSASLREAYMRYMFQYESWNITTEQYREWGAAYETYCEEGENGDGEWHEVYDPDTGEYLCRVFVAAYEGMGMHVDGDKMTGAPFLTRLLTVGNVYYFLQERGADLTVKEDGSGFRVSVHGKIVDFGLYPTVAFDDLQGCY